MQDVLKLVDALSIDDKERKQIAGVVRRLEDVKYAASALKNLPLLQEIDRDLVIAWPPHILQSPQHYKALMHEREKMVNRAYLLFLALVASEASKTQDTSVINFICLLLEATSKKEEDEDGPSPPKELDVTTTKGQQILKEIRETMQQQSY